MKEILILGGGTGGTLMANKLRKSLSIREWGITVVDKDPMHHYQPGYLFIPFGTYSASDVLKPKSAFYPKGVKAVFGTINRIDADANMVYMADGSQLPYHYLLIATGTSPRPEETPGLTGDLWGKTIFDFYTLEGATALGDFFSKWEGGSLLLAIAEQPIKCPVAPLEFVFLADSYFTRRGIRNKISITLVTPSPDVFSKPKTAKLLGSLLKEKNIRVVTDFYIERVDNQNSKLVSYDGREEPFDALTIVPVNMGSEAIARSGLGNDLNYVPTNKHTLQSEMHPNIFVLGDASNIPSSKAGSVVHFAGEVVFENLISAINNQPLQAYFDGHANCFIETGNGKAALIDFNYETEPLEGYFPIPAIGPFSLLRETRTNHWGKLFFKYIYWHIMVKGRYMPLGSNMSMSGKKRDST